MEVAPDVVKAFQKGEVPLGHSDRRLAALGNFEDVEDGRSARIGELRRVGAGQRADCGIIGELNLRPWVRVPLEALSIYQYF